MWNTSLGNRDGGSKGLGCAGMSVQGVTNVPEGNISPRSLLLQDSSSTSATGKGASRGIWENATRNKRCHLQLSPGSALNPHSFRLHSSMKSGETPCGRHGIPETWEEF